MMRDGRNSKPPSTGNTRQTISRPMIKVLPTMITIRLLKPPTEKDLVHTEERMER